MVVILNRYLSRRGTVCFNDNNTYDTVFDIRRYKNMLILEPHLTIQRKQHGITFE